MDVRKTYRMGDVEVRALSGVSLDIEAGDFVAIMGPSGSGKSTLMHVLGLLDVPDAGSYRLFDREIQGLSDDDLAALRSRTVGFIFQQFNLLSRTNALENAALPLLYSREEDASARPLQMLKDVGLGDRIGHKPNEMSGGQQQRVAIARALVNDPKIILADEPTGNLDSKSQEEIMGLFHQMNDRGITVVIVTHEEDVAKHAKRIIRMRDGCIRSDERTADIRRPVSETGARVLAPEAARGSSIGKKIKETVSHFHQALRALSANKIRTGLSMLGILIGVAAVIAMLALGAGAKKSIEERLSSLGSNLLMLRPGSMRLHGVAMEAGAVTRFTTEDAAEIRKTIPHIRNVSSFVQGRGQAGYGNKNWNTQLLGTTPEYALMRATVPNIGRFFTAAEEKSRAKVVVIGRTLVRELFNPSGPAGTSMTVDPLGEYIKINRVNFQVIGVLPDKGSSGWRDENDQVIIPLSTAMYRVLGKEYVDEIDIEVDQSENMPAVETALKELVIRTHRLPPNKQDTFEVRNLADIQSAVASTSQTLSMLLASIAAISLIVGGIGIMNIMLVSVTERTREIGLRKAVGARRRDILAQFLIESVVVSALGGLSGIALGWLITVVMAKFVGWTVSVSMAAVLLSFLFSAAVGIVFGFWPAHKASKLNPIEALRYE